MEYSRCYIFRSTQGELVLGGGFEEIDRTDVVDSSNEEYVKRFDVPSKKKLWLNIVFVLGGPKMVPQVKHFRKSSTNFQGLK